ncbi:MAG: hypothetical protein [Bacteriophage sp.]|nr:MAG: hypothetical protein [Bacteriophage sp.]
MSREIYRHIRNYGIAGQDGDSVDIETLNDHQLRQLRGAAEYHFDHFGNEAGLNEIIDEIERRRES